jgi:hypothetical protein
MASPQVILLKGKLQRRREEIRAGGAIKPGHLISVQAAGTVVVHPTAGGTAGAGRGTPLSVALEDDFQGRGIDDAYAATDLVQDHLCQPGDELYMFLKTANNATLATPLTSAGDGALKLANGTTDQNMFMPVEALNNTSGSDSRLRVRAL